MEAVDNALVEGAILWLAQTILSNLLLDNLDSWIRHVGLTDETEKLMSEVERIEMVVAAARGRANGVRPLTRLLARLKELMYDADDMVDELDYYRLQHQVQGEGGMFASANEQERTDEDAAAAAEQVDGSGANPDIPSSSSTGKRRSKAWAHFEQIAPGRAKCKYCGTELQCETVKGTSVLHNHLKSNNCRTKRAAIEQTAILSSAVDGAQNGAMSSTHASESRKRKRIDEVSAIAPNTPANSHTWNKAKFYDRIQQTTHELHQVISELQKLYASAPVVSSNICQDTVADPCRRTSSLIKCKMYGRHAEKNSILKMMTEGTSDGLLVVPILGIGGIGKTALAQSVYNDPTVKVQFVHKIWIWVSNNFDEVRLTMEMLDFVSQEKHVGISSLAKLQEILSSHVTSNKTLLVLDDVWDDINDRRWNKLLAPFRSDSMEDNVILVTTRKLSIAKTIGTVKQIELCGMQSDDFWLLFKKCSFGDETYQEQPSLNIIGQQIAKKLHHNPLAAETAGMLLRQHLTTDHWRNILKTEKWKSLQLSGGIMASLKLSYDNLPENLQQCFRYCCLFPKKEALDGVELVRIWISQGYVHGNHTGKKLEDMGNAYVAELVNFGFFAKQLHNSNCFIMPDLMYDLAWELSGADFATIDDKECKKILPTTRHLSIAIDSDYETFSDENMKKNLLQVTSVRRLRSLMLIGHYDPSFFAFFLKMFREVENLRFLQIWPTFADFVCCINNLVSCTHIRYIQAHIMESFDEFGVSFDEFGVLPRALTNFFHLQVLDLGLDTSITLPSGMSNLVSMQHLVGEKEIHSTIACIGKMTALQELPVFNVRNAIEFDIRQLQSMDQLVQLHIFQLKNIKSKQEAGEARLADKGNLEELCLSWESWESDSEFCSSEAGDSDNSNLGISRETTSEVLEGLKPHQNVKHLQIIGYSGSVFSSWLSIELTCLQLLHLENCNELRVLPVQELPFLRKLKLINIYHVPEIAIPCLEELELNRLPSLKKCIVTCRKELDFYLQVLIIMNCGELMVFPPFETQSLCSSQVEQRSWTSNQEGTSSEQKQWLSGLRKLTLHGCPHLMLSHPLPPAPATQVSIQGLSTHPAIQKHLDRLSVMSSNELRVLDAKIFAFQYLKELTSLHIADCPNLMSFSFEGFRELHNLEILKIIRCGTLVPSCNMSTDAVSEDWKGTNCPALPRLRSLQIESCGAIAGKWLTEMLPHMQSLEELVTEDCPQIKSISIHCPRQDPASVSLASTLRCEAVLPPHVTRDEFLFHIPLNVLSTLKILCIRRFPTAELSGSTDGFGGFTSLTKLDITNCPMLPSSGDERPSTFIRKRRYYLPPFLKELLLSGQDLEFVWLHSCVALDMLHISNCRQLAELEGLQELRSLRVLSIELHPGVVEEGNHRTFQLPIPIEKVSIKYLRDETAPHLLGCFPFLSKLEVLDSPDLVSFQLGSLTALEELEIQRSGSLESLQGFLLELKVFICDSQKLTYLQLGSPTALIKLKAHSCEWLASLESLQSLENLAELEIHCDRVPLPLPPQAEGFAIFPLLETLRIYDLSALTISFCKYLTSLRHLIVSHDYKVAHFTDDQENALQLLKSLQSLEFLHCYNLARLPDVLHSLHSLVRLNICYCEGMSRLPDKGLPQSLEELDITGFRAELKEECRRLATAKLRVKIDGRFVN